MIYLLLLLQISLSRSWPLSKSRWLSSLSRSLSAYYLYFPSSISPPNLPGFGSICFLLVVCDKMIPPLLWFHSRIPVVVLPESPIPSGIIPCLVPSPTGQTTELQALVAVYANGIGRWCLSPLFGRLSLLFFCVIPYWWIKHGKWRKRRWRTAVWEITGR